MTPAEHLSAAATRLRELAGAATPGVWAWEDWQDGPERWQVYSDKGFETVGVDMGLPNAAYIAAMSPPVALALADWLEHEGRHYAECGAADKEWRYAAARAERSLALAALIVPATAEVES